MIISYSFALDCSYQRDNSGIYIQTYVISLPPSIKGLYFEYALCIFESHDMNKNIITNLEMNNVMRSGNSCVEYGEVCPSNLKYVSIKEACVIYLTFTYPLPIEPPRYTTIFLQ